MNPRKMAVASFELIELGLLAGAVTIGPDGGGGVPPITPLVPQDA